MQVRDCRARLGRFLGRYLPVFYRQEQRGHAAGFVRGLLSGIERQAVEPSARQAGIPRKNLQLLLGQGARDDQAVGSAMRRHVAEVLGRPDGIIVLDCDVPHNTDVRDPEGDRPAKKPGRYARPRAVPFLGAGEWAAGLPAGRRTRPTIRDGTGGPLAEVVRVRSQRHRIERVFEEAEGEVGLGHSEVQRLGGPASPRPPEPAGVVVLDPRAGAGRGEKPRR